MRDSFLDLGGNSLVAARLITQVNRMLHANLDVLTLLTHPTIEALASAVARASTGSGKPRLVALRTAGAGTPVVFVNAFVQIFRLTRTLRGGNPFYVSEVALEPKVLEASVRHDSSEFPSIAEMAAPHAALIQEAGLADSCVLAGYSYGGVLAFEVARQLAARGTRVDAVLLFDSDIRKPLWGRCKDWWARHIRNAVRQGPGYLWRGARRRLEAVVARPLPESVDLSNHEVPWEIIDRIWVHSLARYRPRALATRGVLFRALDSPYYGDPRYDAWLGWRRLFTEGVEVVEAGGNHASMWQEPHLVTLARATERALDALKRPGS